MKTKKVLLTVAAFALVAVAAVSFTFAYLTDGVKTVTNTFTIGEVTIDLLEHQWDPEENDVTDEEVYVNEYKLMPGHEYVKDPFVRVGENSEDCWLFIKIDNPLEEYIDANGTYGTIEEQLEDKGWSLVEGTEDVYAYEGICSADDEVQVFDGFKLIGDIDDEEYKALDGAEIVIKAYAIQADGFTTADEAWDAAPSDWGVSAETPDTPPEPDEP